MSIQPISTRLATLLAALVTGLICTATLAAEPEEHHAPPKPVATGLLGPALHTGRLEEMVAFYRDGLGLTVLRNVDLPKATETILGFEGQGGGPTIIIYQPEDGGDGSVSGSRLILRTDDADALAARLRNAGHDPGEVRANAVNQMKVFFVKDPDGRSVEIVEYPMPAAP